MMQNRRARWIELSLVVAALAVFCHPAHATRMWTPQEFEEFAASRVGQDLAPERRPERTDRSSLDDVPYYFHFLRLMEFLDGMQYTQPGNNRGGMIEGERNGNEGIIETDNTQEAIREWSQYALWSGDTSTYHANIDRAWEYCWRYPAWHEGDGGFNYYSAHNIGWGFEAVKKYREAYGDTSKNRYADSCAAWMVAHQLNWSDNDPVQAYSEGLGLGGMYAHAVYRGRTDWRTYCVNRARALKNWLQGNVARMRNEDWALCGGTAVWGVCNSLFQEYPDSGATWLGQYGHEMDEWVTANWGNSYNTWYANAHFIAYELTGDTSFWNVGVTSCEALIALDTESDNDGGIFPGTCCNGNPRDDHSWVSAYMGWMGMERIINRLPERDVAVAAVISPDTSLPYLAGDSLTVSVHVINAGREAMSGTLTVNGANYVHTINFDFAEGEDSIFTFSESWIVPDTPQLPERTPLLFVVNATGDSNSANDSLLGLIDIRHGIELQGQVRDLLDPNAQLPCHVKVWHSSYQGEIWTEFDVAADGNYTSGERPLMAGFNLIEVTPPVKYLVYREQVELAGQPPLQNLNIDLERADLLLVDDDVDQGYESYYQSPLAQLGLDVRTFNRSSGITGTLNDIPTVVWFTGNDSTTTLLPWDEEQLTSYVNQGGRLLLSGQNITDDLGTGNTFLNNVLHCERLTNNTNSRRLFGIVSSEFGEGLELIIQTGQGANNQTSPSSVTVLAGGSAQFEYQGSGEDGLVIGQYGLGKTAFCSFGVEAISGVNNSTSCVDFLAAALDWLDLPVSADETPVPLPDKIWLSQNFPNPFNAATTLSFYSPRSSDHVNLSIFNLLGQHVETLYDGTASGSMQTIHWNPTLSSGWYSVRLHSGATVITKSLQLIR